jgi:hypothetical protein
MGPQSRFAQGYEIDRCKVLRVHLFPSCLDNASLQPRVHAVLSSSRSGDCQGQVLVCDGYVVAGLHFRGTDPANGARRGVFHPKIDHYAGLSAQQHYPENANPQRHVCYGQQHPNSEGTYTLARCFSRHSIEATRSSPWSSFLT